MIVVRTLQEATSLSDLEAKQVWDTMVGSPFRTVMEFELNQRVLAEQANFANLSSHEDFLKQKGVVEGLQVAIGILNRKQTPHPKK